jgi:DNA-directed RNA polymerase specialized sigma subunit
MKSEKFQFDPHFSLFASVLENTIAGYDVDKKKWNQLQKNQIEGLIKLERKFRRKLKKHKWGKGSYLKFIDYFTEKNILTAQPYFRERKDIFGQKIIPAIKKRNVNKLFTYDINFPFINFILKQYKWGKNSELRQIADQIVQLRKEIIELNMPLAISRARIFWSVTPNSHLGYMDLVQIGAEGLISAIDKFVLPYRPVFRSVAIGMMKGNFIEKYSDTLLHFFPRDRNVLYRAHKFNRQNPEESEIDNIDKMVEGVNKNVIQNNKLTNSSELRDLLTASSHVSLDATLTNDHGEESEQQFADNSNRPDLLVEQNDAAKALKLAYTKLTNFERKILMLKGIEIPWMN